jgi:1-aminocyclopropane-1-carboxylate deaminase/D-cysteine desulfhydrase-like pyridoxal-dependent ACC family enzyme
VERMVGAHVSLVSKEEYVKYGSVMLCNLLADQLKSQGRKPYVIPVGGSNSLGTWYAILHQSWHLKMSHVSQNKDVLWIYQMNALSLL